MRASAPTQQAPAVTESQAINRVVRDFLCSHGLDNLVHDMEAQFTSVHYFSCSVQMQHSPSADPSKVLTNGIADPLRWLLAKNGIEVE